MENKNKDDFITTFYNAQDSYLKDKDTESWNIMFLNCQKVCEVTLSNFARKKKLSLPHERFLEVSTEAALRIMNRYKKPNGYKIDYLRTVCRFSLFDVMYNKKEQFNDRLICYGLEYREDDDNDNIANFNDEV